MMQTFAEINTNKYKNFLYNIVHKVDRENISHKKTQVSRNI